MKARFSVLLSSILLLIISYSFYVGHRSATIRSTKSLDSSFYIIVDKSDFELRVYDAEGWYATYPVVFGSKDPGDKMREGDKKTPNGSFKVILKKIHKQWGQELLLDYQQLSLDIQQISLY